MAEKVYKQTEVAEILACSIPHVNQLLNRGAIKWVGREGSRRVLESDLVEYIERAGVRPTRPVPAAKEA